MSRIEDMIKTLCPDGVKWVKLGDVCEKICSGGTPSRNRAEYFEGNIPWLRTQEVDWKDVYDTEIKITQEAVENSSAKIIPANCIIVAMYGATAGKSCINRIPLTTNQACCNLQINDKYALVKYVFFWICYNYENIKAMGEGSQNNINANKIKNLSLPLPPHAIQQSIVDVLDKFEAMRTNLNAELALRRKQYEHYREKLLTFGDDVERVKVCDFCELRAGKSINASELSDDNEYWCYGGNGTRGKVNFYSHSGEYAIIGRQGALCGCVSWATGNFYATEHAVVVTPKKNVNSRFLFHLFTFSNLNQYKSQGAQPGLAVSKLNELIFQIPNYATQQSIVSKLDKFEALISNIERELELRTKQYEYYREKLLTF